MKSEEQATAPSESESASAAPTRTATVAHADEPRAPAAEPHAPADTPHAAPPPARRTTAQPARPSSNSPSSGSLVGTSRPRAVGHRPRREPMAHEQRVLLMALAAGAPGVVVSLALLWAGGYTPKVVWTLAALVVCFWLGFAFAVRGRVVRPLQTVSNLLAALGEGDYSFRARGGRGQDALSEVIREINALGETMREQRIGALEATALLRTVMSEIDV
ncbi:MAG TPA: hypothetical protein VNZ44_03835, partial [Pyrinomonadaceae bacterium]|nr:hypothetical protein [Pyrinomonadaceae bacterium]